ncbi:hypothetical protein FCV25MIE_17491 [Fagus crenata]
MASLCVSTGISTRPAQGFHRSSGCARAQVSTTNVLNLKQLPSKLSQIPFYFRFKNTARLQKRQKLFIASASNSNPSGDSNKEKSSGIKTSDTAQGPPFLTILAGVLVFVLIGWIFGSIIMWLIGLVVKVPPSN